MESRYRGQDVVRCTLCTTALAPMHCEVCQIDLCKDCVEKHLSEQSKSQVHKVVSLKQYHFSWQYPKCLDHPGKQCELHCKECDVPICSQCVISKKHKHHEIVDIEENYQNNQEGLRRDLQELENSIYPQYQEFIALINDQKAEQCSHSEDLKAALNKHGEILHKEIDSIIKRKQSEIEDRNTQHLTALNNQEDAIKHTMKEIKQVISDLKRIVQTGDISLATAYKSRNCEFRKLPPIITMSPLNFKPPDINREQLLQQVGPLCPFSNENKAEEVEEACPPPSTEAKISPKNKPLLNVPYKKAKLNAGYGSLKGVSCRSEEEIWTRGFDKIMKLYNLQGELVNQVQTLSGNAPEDFAVTRIRELVYTDYKDRSINIVRDTYIQVLVRLRGWRPRFVCTAFSDDILVIMDSDDDKQTKIVRYADSKEKQHIQWDANGLPLYLPGYNLKHMCENRNLDICVADSGARAVVVVNEAGTLRLKYTGPPAIAKESFRPYGITTDSQARILTADYENHRIHVVDQDGIFLRYIDNCGLHRPWGLCVDPKDNLFVAENKGIVKKIKYCK